MEITTNASYAAQRLAIPSMISRCIAWLCGGPTPAATVLAGRAATADRTRLIAFLASLTTLAQQKFATLSLLDKPGFFDEKAVFGWSPTGLGYHFGGDVAVLSG